MVKNVLKHTLLLILIVQLAGLSFCSQPALDELSPSDPVVIECWHYYNNVQQANFDKLIQTFNDTIGREKGVQVVAESKGNVAELASAVTAAASSGGGNEAMPDLFAAYADTAYDLADQGRLVDLNTYLSDKDLEIFQPDFLAEGYFGSGGSLYILPLAKSSEAVAVNLTAWQAFAAANPRFTDPAATLSTWETVGLAAEAYRHWSGGKALFGLDSLDNFLIIGSRQLGVDLLQADSSGAGLLDLDREALHQLWDIYYNNTVAGGFDAYGGYCSDKLASGQIIAGVVSTASGSWLPEQAQTAAGTGAIEIGVLPYPVFSQGQPVCVQQGAGMAVARSDSRHETGAVLLLSWLIRPEQNVAFTVPAGYLPVTRPALQSQLLQDSLADLDEAGAKGTSLCLQAFLSQMDYSRLYFSAAFKGSYNVRRHLEESLADLANDARLAWQQDQKTGAASPAGLDLYTNEAIFEKWYSQLINDTGRLLN